MIEFLTKISEIIVNDDEANKTKRTIYWIKSLFFLILIVTFVTNIYWDVKGCINNLLSDYLQIKILNFAKLANHFFVTLTLISLVVLIIFTVRLTLPKYKKLSISKQKNILEIGRGSLIRCSNSFENVMISSLICYFLDDNFCTVFASNHPNSINCLLIALFITQFRISIYRGIKNRFFISNPEVDIIEKLQ